MATSTGCEVTKITELAIEVYSSELTQKNWSMPTRNPARMISNRFRRERHFIARYTGLAANGKSKRVAASIRKLAIITGGASARRVKTEAAAMPNTPRSNRRYVLAFM
jgi:hypothetical protein